MSLPKYQFKLRGGDFKGVWALLDVDDFIRKDKKPLSKELEHAIQICRVYGMCVGFVTGAPFSHVGGLTVVDLILAESGGVEVHNGRMNIWNNRKYDPRNEGLARLMGALGLVPDKVFQEMSDGTVILEGPRKASLTILCEGTPPHFPTLTASAKRLDVETRVREYSWHNGMEVSSGSTDSYSWIDIMYPWNTKAAAIGRSFGSGVTGTKVYYGGDGSSDLDVLQKHSTFTPLGVQNSIPEIRQLARERGIYVDKPGPCGGVLEIFERFTEGLPICYPLIL